ncbi:MAG: cobalamin biosynthesis protein CobD [Firmicutes bacterium]|nr:cobalamin biosynthesis protein CobD [Bacillota bacterium]
MLDLIIGDPHGWPHLVILYGRLISFLEKLCYSWKPKRLAGAVLVLCMLLFSIAVPSLVLYACWKIHPAVYVIAGGILCWQCLAAKSLKDESGAVAESLRTGGLEAGRKAVSWIVGRDTDVLDEAGVIKAAVETVAENTSDGEIAPLFYMALMGPVGGCLYKAVNTMDSMLGYRNERYERFGTAAARLDDVFNFIPARLAAIIMIMASAAAGLSTRDALRIWKRDRYKHASPNSAQTESVMAGALQVQLAGDAVYGGVIHKKEFIGDEIRPIELEDIRRSQRLMTATAVLAFAAAVTARVLVMSFIIRGL